MNGENGHRALGLASIRGRRGRMEWWHVGRGDVGEWTVTLCGGVRAPVTVTGAGVCACGWWCSPARSAGEVQRHGGAAGGTAPPPEGPQCACGPAGRYAAAALAAAYRAGSWPQRHHVPAGEPPSATTTALCRGWCACGHWCSPYDECDGEQCNGTHNGPTSWCGVRTAPTLKGPSARAVREAASARQAPPSQRRTRRSSRWYGGLGGERAEERDQHGQDPRACRRVSPSSPARATRPSRRSTSPTALRPSPRGTGCGPPRGTRPTGGHGLDTVASSPSTGRCATCAGPAGQQLRTRLEDRRPRQHRVLWHQDQPGRQLRGHRHVRRAHLQVRPQDVRLRRDLLVGQRAADSGARQRRQQRPASGRGGRRLRHRDQAGRLVLRARRRVPRREHIHRRRLVRRAHPQGRRNHVLHDDHRAPQRLGRRRSLCHPPEQGVPPHGLRREDPAS